MNVYYDRKNDVVTIYLDAEDNLNKDNENSFDNIDDKREYEVEEAAGLLLDMVDMVDNNGNLMGFRVFNASRYYDLELLNCADIEELAPDELEMRPVEKIIKTIPNRP